MATNDDLDQLEPQEQELEDDELDADPDDPELLVAEDDDADPSDEGLDESLPRGPHRAGGGKSPKKKRTSSARSFPMRISSPWNRCLRSWCR